MEYEEETIVVIRPPPRFSEIKREQKRQGTIWVVNTPRHGIIVSRSATGIVRAMKKVGVKMWVSSIYHGRNRGMPVIRCKDARDVNDALRDAMSATFVVVNPYCWVIEKENVITDMGEHDA